MKKKLIIYGIITLLWIVICTILYYCCLINLTGIIISFVFAFPTMVYDIISTHSKNKRTNILKSINQLQVTIQSIENKKIDGSVIEINEAEAKRYIQIIWDKEKTDKLLTLLKNDTDKFSDMLHEELSKMKPDEIEVKIYDLYT